MSQLYDKFQNLKCSAKCQDSNAEKSREVAIPPKTRPNIKTLY